MYVYYPAFQVDFIRVLTRVGVPHMTLHPDIKPALGS